MHEPDTEVQSTAPPRRAPEEASPEHGAGPDAPLRIAQVAPLHESVPPRLYGGTERVVAYLVEELIRLGHEVTLFASGDSRTRARLVPCAPRALRLDGRCRDPLAPHVVLLEQVARAARAGAFDLIHAHVDYLGFPLQRRLRTPLLTTLHGRLDLRELRGVFREFADVALVSISRAQRRPRPLARWVGNVHHGLPPDLYRFEPQGGDYLAFVGRICRDKGIVTAIRIAQETGLPLRIGAKVDADDRAYFEREVRPLLRPGQAELLGEVDEAGKQELLGGARALLFPIDWPEPFGLVMIEALACGTPVLARPRGAVPEVLRHGVSGLLFETVEEGCRAVENAARLDRAACRREFEQRFSAARMAHDYVALYRAAVAARRGLAA